MGSAICGTSAVADYTEIQLKELKSAKPVFDVLGIAWDGRDATQFHSYYDHAVDNSEGLANVNQLCKTLRLPREHFYTNSFLVFGNQSKSVSGNPANKWQMAAKATVERCSMSQYVVGIWNLCTLSLPHGMAIWMYRMHFGNDGAHPANVLELLDKRYGISEERDYHAQIDKRWYGSDYHKNNLARTKAMVNRYTNQETKRMSPAGWLELIKKSPGLLQNHIAARVALRRQVLGEKFWKRMDKMKKKSEDLKNIDGFVRILETEEPGHLVTIEGREFFNVDHYNFNAPTAAAQDDLDLHVAPEDDENDYMYAVEDDGNGERILPQGQQMSAATAVENVPPKVLNALNAVDKMIERPDAAERKKRAERYTMGRGAEKAKQVHVERGRGQR